MRDLLNLQWFLRHVYKKKQKSTDTCGRGIINSDILSKVSPCAAAGA